MAPAVSGTQLPAVTECHRLLWPLRDELIAGLSQVLPEVVDKLTPQGRVPTEQELSRSL